jgi:hypothetical protein
MARSLCIGLLICAILASPSVAEEQSGVEELKPNAPSEAIVATPLLAVPSKVIHIEPQEEPSPPEMLTPADDPLANLCAVTYPGPIVATTPSPPTPRDELINALTRMVIDMQRAGSPFLTSRQQELSTLVQERATEAEALQQEVDKYYRLFFLCLATNHAMGTATALTME